MERQARLSLDRILPQLEQRLAMGADLTLWEPFKTRLETHFEKLFGALLLLYGGRYDFFYHLESIVEMAARMWQQRSPTLKALDAERERRPERPGIHARRRCDARSISQHLAIAGIRPLTPPIY